MRSYDWFMSHEAAIRLGCFAAILAAMAGWEGIAPRRALSLSRTVRWPANLGIVLVNGVLLRFLFPAAAAGMAAFAGRHGWGLFNYIEVPFWVAAAGSVIALDFVIYTQHVMFHAVPVLWRLHRVHHTDLDIDVTTGVRFHPLEILLSLLIKFAAVVVLGPPVFAVVFFEVLLNGTAMFNHGNVRLPRALDRVLRWVVVTPDMHRVHHSVEPDETNSNFGFNLPWWDRLFGTYRAQPRLGHTAMTIGIRTFRDAATCSRLPRMLALPFTGRITDYTLNRRAGQTPEAHQTITSSQRDHEEVGR